LQLTWFYGSHAANASNDSCGSNALMIPMA
jgi:hypothetical protein